MFWRKLVIRPVSRMDFGRVRRKCNLQCPEMISLLDRSRHLLEELSSELGVTDPVSGSVVFEA